ncbi:hypothetical protein HK104_006230 [Borealophlyctis nickersoniae]|nr:hypothetical protein HK104_006230 [Borealophlyctis nickersoniae]
MPDIHQIIMDFVVNQVEKLPELPKYDTAGRVIIITGANTGLGYEASLHLARTNPKKLVLACRDSTKASTTAERVAEATGCDPSILEPMALDLSSFASVKKFAEEFKAKGWALDALICNAGVASLYRETEDGFDITVQVNVLSTFLVPFLLMPSLRAAVSTTTNTNTSPPHPRIVILTSGVHEWVGSPTSSTITLAALNSPDYPTFRYGVSKLQEVFLARHMATLLASSTDPRDKHIGIRLVDPGLCHSDLTRAGQRPKMTIFKRALARSAEEGSRGMVMAALDKDLEGEKPGVAKYVSGMKEGEVSEFVRSEEGKEFQSVLWKELMEILEGVADLSEVTEMECLKIKEGIHV